MNDAVATAVSAVTGEERTALLSGAVIPGSVAVTKGGKLVVEASPDKPAFPAEETSPRIKALTDLPPAEMIRKHPDLAAGLAIELIIDMTELLNDARADSREAHKEIRALWLLLCMSNKANSEVIQELGQEVAGLRKELDGQRSELVRLRGELEQLRGERVHQESPVPGIKPWPVREDEPRTRKPKQLRKPAKALSKPPRPKPKAKGRKRK